ncbi:MAG: glycosyltransferase family 9 protein [Thalassobaculaceae bacterium]
MRILFITSSRVGDAVLTTGLLKYLIDKYPKARFTIACGPVARGLFENVPRLDRVIPMRKGPILAHWRKLFGTTITRQWYMVVDMRGSALAWCLLTPRRYIYKRCNRQAHRLEDMRHTLKLTKPADPYIWLNEKNDRFADSIISQSDFRPVLVVGPTANWDAKIWPTEKFIELINRLVVECPLLINSRIAVVGGPGEEDIAKPVLDAIKPDRKIDLVGPIPFLDVAAVFKRALIYVGNDSGLMHLCAATGTPTLGLFGPTRDENYSPWGDHCDFVRSDETFQELSLKPDFKPDPTGSLMGGLSVEKVFNATIKLLESRDG